MNKTERDPDEDREKVLQAGQYTPKEHDAFGMLLGLDGWDLLVRRAFKSLQGERQQLLTGKHLTKREQMLYIGHLEGVLRLLSMPYAAVGEPVPPAILAFFRGDL